MSANDPAAAANAAHALREAYREIKEHLAKQTNGPAASSQINTELNESADYVGYLETAYGQGHVLIEVAEDHLLAFLKMVDSLQQSIAPWTCVRGILEASAVASWLLDDGIAAKERVGRSFAFRYESMDQERKFIHSKGYDESVILARIELVESQATRLGFRKLRDRKNRRFGIAQRLPKMIELTRDLLGDESAYRILSGMAHGRSWVAHQLGFRRAGRSKSDSGVSLVHLEKQMPSVGMVYLCKLASLCFGRAIRSRCKLYGWDSSRVSMILKFTDDEMRRMASS